MFGMPENSSFDLRFQLLGIPVRVTPWFWIFAVLLHGGNVEPISDLLIWVICVFLSIMIHELGHGLMARAFGCWPTIALHGGFGACYTQPERQSFWQRLAVILAGPGAGFLTFGLILGADASLTTDLSPLGERFLSYMTTINLVWSVFNLFPIIPLDGGQFMGTVLGRLAPRNGMRWSHVVSLVLAGLMACYMFSRGNLWMTFLFGLFAFMNYQALQALYQYARSGDDPDRWR